MQRIVPGLAHALYNGTTTRVLEAQAAADLPPHTLMERAGLATARLALAIAPHAQRWWIACGPGNNGGDGLEAAVHLQQWGKTVLVSWLGTPDTTPYDARASHARAVAAGVQLVAEPPANCDGAIDALLGLGISRSPDDRMAQWIAHLNALDVPVLAVDLPSGLNADTGHTPGPCVRASHTLSLLTLKPGLYTAQGRDHCGEIWLDTLGVSTTLTAMGQLNARPAPEDRPHASHKGSYGDVAVIGGAPGMGGAALLAARAALHHGAGRVYVGLLDGSTHGMDTGQPELMLRSPAALDSRSLTVVAGCGGGSVIATELPRLLSTAPRLVLDADALNAMAADTQLQSQLRARQHRGYATVLTPHPLEAARLLSCSVSKVQQDRPAAAIQLVEQTGACVVLKGSGTIILTPGAGLTFNPTGNARLATAGTGDVLAGLIGAELAQGKTAFEAACAAVWAHGLAADQWPEDRALTADALARQI